MTNTNTHFAWFIDLDADEVMRGWPDDDRDNGESIDLDQTSDLVSLGIATN